MPFFSRDLCHVFFSALLLGASMVCVPSDSSRAALQSVADPVPPAQPATSSYVRQHELMLKIGIERTHLLESRLAELQTQLVKMDQLRASLRDKQDELGFSMESYGEIVGSLQAQRVEMIIDLAGLEARREALQNVAADVQKSTRNVALQEELEQLLRWHEEKLARVTELHQKGTASAMEVQEARRGVIEARIRLGEVRNNEGTGGNPFVASALISVSLDRAEKQARLDRINGLLQQLIAERSQVSELEELNRKYDQALTDSASVEKAIDDTADKIRAAEQALEQQQMLEKQPGDL